MPPQLTLYVPGSQALVLSLDGNDLDELSALFDGVSSSSKLYPVKQELNNQIQKQWFKDHAERGGKPYY